MSQLVGRNSTGMLSGNATIGRSDQNYF
jgi:hypothetical protein